MGRETPGSAGARKCSVTRKTICTSPTNVNGHIDISGPELKSEGGSFYSGFVSVF